MKELTSKEISEVSGGLGVFDTTRHVLMAAHGADHVTDAIRHVVVGKIFARGLVAGAIISSLFS